MISRVQAVTLAIVAVVGAFCAGLVLSEDDDLEPPAPIVLEGSGDTTPGSTDVPGSTDPTTTTRPATTTTIRPEIIPPPTVSATPPPPDDDDDDDGPGDDDDDVEADDDG